MKLTLDHTQRLNLHALLGAQRADVGLIRMIWAIQDKIALDAYEEKSIELKREIAGGHERAVWNANLSLPVKDFEFSDQETARIRVLFRPGNPTPLASTGCGCNLSSTLCSRPFETENPLFIQPTSDGSDRPRTQSKSAGPKQVNRLS